MRHVWLWSRGGERDRDVGVLQRLDQLRQSPHRRQPAARQRAIETLLFLFVLTPLLARYVPLEQQGKDVAVAAAVKTGAVLSRQRRKAVTLSEQAERLGVQVHVVGDGAVDVDDDGLRRERWEHNQ